MKDRGVQNHRSLAAAVSLLSRDERVRAIWLSLAMVAAGLIDMAALASVMPLVGLIIEPGLFVENEMMRSAVAALGNPEFGDAIALFAVVAVVLLFLSSVSRIAINHFAFHFAARCQVRLMRELTTTLMQVPSEWFLRRNSAAVGRVIYEDVAIWGTRFIRALTLVVNSTFTLLLSAVIVFVLSPLAGVAVLLVVGAAVFGVMLLIRPRISRLSQYKRDKSEEMMVHTIKTIAGIRDIKLSSREGYFADLMYNAFRGIAHATASVTFWHTVSPTVMVLLGQLTLVGVVFVLWASGVGSGEIAAQVALLVLVSSRCVPAFNQITTNVTQFWDAMPFVENIAGLRRDLLGAAVSVVERSAAPALEGSWRSVQFKDIAFCYQGSDERVLDGLDFELVNGRSYGIVGPSGAGKSTLVDILLGLLDPTSGEVLVDGRPLAAMNLKSWQRRLAYVPQDPFIADDTLRANVAFGVEREDVDDDFVRNCLEQANLGALLAGLPEGLDTAVSERGARFSGGEKQRIAIARTLYNHPELLVLDEATSALDSQSEMAVRKAVVNLKGRVTTVIVAHRYSTIRHCDEILVLDRGRIVARGGYDALLHDSPMFQQLVHGAVAV